MISSDTEEETEPETDTDTEKRNRIYKRGGGGAPPRTPFIRVPLHAVAYNGTKRMIYFAF